MVRKSTRNKPSGTSRTRTKGETRSAAHQPTQPNAARRSKAPAAALSRGIVATRHSQIRKAGLAVLANRNRDDAVSALAMTIVDALREDFRPRRRGQQVSIAKRVGALLRAYCPKIPTDVAVRVRTIANAQLAPVVEQTRISIDSVYVSERVAALRLGITASDLREMCVDRETRRRLGWPRPIAGRLLFRSAALDPESAGEFFASLAEKEPWPRHSWPEEWRS